MRGKPHRESLDNRFHHSGTEFTELGNGKMRHLLEDITSSISGGEESAKNEDGLTAEEKTRLRELCVLIVISEFFENNRETGLDTRRPQKQFHHKDTEGAEVGEN